MIVQDVINHLHDLAPLAYAEDFDNVGLLVGDKNQSVSFDCPISVTSWRRLKNDIPFSLSGTKTTVHLQPYSYGYFLGE